MNPVPLYRCMYPGDVSSFRLWMRRHAAAAGTVPVTAAVRGAGDENFPDHRQGMKITLDTPDGMVCGFLNGVVEARSGLTMVTYALDSHSLHDGAEIKLPQEEQKQ